MGKQESCPLLWWQQYGHELDEVLRSIARDFLGMAGSSAATERLFSAAADTCKSSRGGLKLSTMEESICAGQWLKDGVDPGGKWKLATDWRALKAQEHGISASFRRKGK